jgi:hypothetical protein
VISAKLFMILVLGLTGISKYLRHNEATVAKHYDFGVIEASARNRQMIVDLIGGGN